MNNLCLNCGSVSVLYYIHTGPAIPSLLNATGSANDGFDVWGATLVMDPQEASWTSKEKESKFNF